MVIDEDDNAMYVRAAVDMKGEEDVFLVDHAWTFKHRTAVEALKSNEKLRERLENIMKYSAKKDMPVANPYEKKRPSLEDYLKQCEESKEPVLAYDLDSYDIEDLTKIKFRDEAEEISLMDNKISKPTDITNTLMKLPNLKALWLNDNPVQDNCANFNIIGNHFDQLEIFNSKLTSKAGEWAMLFYARDTGAKTLEEIEYLDISGKNLLMVDDISFVKKMKNLKKLDISDNIDMYKPTDMLASEAKKNAEGSGHTTVDFMDNKHHRDELLKQLPELEHLKCDIMLEMYLVEMVKKSGMCQKLKTINRLPINIDELGDRRKEHLILDIMEKIWRYNGTYRLVKPGVMDEEPCFYINDEVGSSITHSDAPNTRMLPFIYSPNCKVDDAATMTYSILWNTVDLKAEEFL